MTDIVERLRRYERAFKGLPEESGWKDAAAEIDRIREALKGATVIANHASAELRAKDEEIERMRFDLASSYSAGFADAREMAAKVVDGEGWLNGPREPFSVYREGMRDCADMLATAIRALKERTK